MTRIKVIAFGAATINCIFLFLPYRTWAYKGPGTIRDYGFFSYPRFLVDLPSMSLNQEHSRRFTFSGVPSEQMSLKLYVVGSSMDDSKTLERLQTQITARLLDESEPTPRLVCAATGSPSAASTDSRWVVHSGATFAAFWHCQCAHLPLSGQRRYALYLEIKTPDSSSPARVLVPTLEGGGIELP